MSLRTAGRKGALPNDPSRPQDQPEQGADPRYVRTAASALGSYPADRHAG